MWQFYSSTCTYPWYIILNFCIIKYLFCLVIDLQDNKFKVQKYKLFCVLSFDDLYIIKDACEQEIINISWLEIKLHEYNDNVFYFIQGTILVNNSDKPLKWMFNLSEKCETLDEGIFKFTHPSGVPFVVMSGEESKGIEGTLEPGKTQQISVIFCPSMYSKF